MTMNEVLQCFPEPDTFEGKSQHSSKIWKYGSFELFFSDKSLYMIFTDDFVQFYGGSSLSIENWSLSKELTFDSFQDRLNSEQIDYRVKHNESLSNTTVFIEDSGVELLFETNEKKYLSAFWKQKI